MNASAPYRKLAVLACLALTILGLASCGSGGSPAIHFASTAAIWFHPKPAAGPTSGGSTDFVSLFQDSAPWPRAMAKTQVIGLYAGWISDIDLPTLQQVVRFINAHNMTIEIEAPSLQALASCGSGVEGYVPYGQTVDDFTFGYLQRLKSLGVKNILAKVDEPYFFGNVVPDPRSCHFSVAKIAAEVGQYAQLVHTVYPDAEVGDVEPIIAAGYFPDVVTALGQWHDTYETVTGSPFPFYIADIDFSNPAWPALVKQVEKGTHQRGMSFGIIYIGDLPDTSDAEWADKAIVRFQTYQGQNGGQPDYVLFQSWDPYPHLCLPEIEPTSFTGVLDAYTDATS
jgi:hypothetical protein